MAHWDRRELNKLIAESPEEYKKRFPEPFSAMIPEDASSENKLATEAYVNEHGGGGSGSDPEAVKYTEQTLTEAQKAQALDNIGGASAESVTAETARATAAEEDIMDAMDGTNVETVTALPAASASTVGKFYYVGPDSNGEYARYRGIESGGSYSFLPVGTTEMNLSTYATKAEVDELEAEVTDLDRKVDTLPVKDMSVYTEVSVPDTDLTVGKVVNKNYGTDAAVPSGTPGTGAVTGYIEIPDGTVRMELLTAFDGDANVNVSFGSGLYDANKTYLGSAYYSNTQVYASLPVGAKYVRFSVLTELTGRKVRFYSKYVPEREAITETRVENITLEENKRLYRNNVTTSTASTPAYCAELKYHPIFAGAETLNHNCRTGKTTGVLIPVADQTSTSSQISLVLYDENLDVVVATDRSDINLSDYPTARYYRIGNFTGDTTRQVTQYIYQHDIEDDVQQLQDTALELGKPLYKSPYELEGYGTLSVSYFHQQKDTAVWGAGYYKLGSTSSNGRCSRYIPVQKGDKFAFCLENHYGANYSVFVLVDAYMNEVDCSQNYTWTVDGKLYSGTYEVTRDDAAYIIFASTFNTYNTAGGIKEKFRLVKLEGYSDNDTVKRSGFVYDAMVAKLRAMEDALNANNITDTLAPVDYVARANEIKSAVDGLGLANKLSFALFTDPHFGGANTGDTLNTMPRLAKAVKQMSDAGIVDFVATLGDNIDNNSETRWTEFKAYLASMGAEYATAVGNHDLLKPSVLRNGQTTITGAVVGSSHNDTWYYFDKSGIRFIVLNGCDKEADDDADTQTRGLVFNGFSTYQMSWLVSTLATTLPVVILTHYGLAATYTDGGWSITGGNGYETVIDVVEGFINGISGSVTIGETAIPFDFTGQGEGNVIGVFCGHMHGDRVQFKDDLFYNIWTDNALAYDTINGIAFSQGRMVLGTVSEVAMDIVTIDLDTFKIYTHRLGRGTDRVVEN